METRGNLRSMIEDKMSEASDLVKYDRAERKRRREERRRRPKKKPYVLMFEAFVTRLVGRSVRGTATDRARDEPLT